MLLKTLLTTLLNRGIAGQSRYSLTRTTYKSPTKIRWEIILPYWWASRLRPRSTCFTVWTVVQEGLAVASIARDDPSPLPACIATRPQCTRMHCDSQCMRAHCGLRAQCAVNLDRNLKPKLATMRQCNSVTDRRTERRTLTS